jgi:phage shock protein C
MREKLFRSRRQRVLAGVAGGLAQYFNIDPIIVRVLLVVATILHGVGVLLYIILWIVIPEEPFEQAYGINTDPTSSEAKPEGENVPPIMDGIPPLPKKHGNGRFIAGSILIGIGLIFLFDRFIPSIDFGDIIPFIFVVLGGILIINSVKK